MQCIVNRTSKQLDQMWCLTSTKQGVSNEADFKGPSNVDNAGAKFHFSHSFVKYIQFESTYQTWKMN
jgi:hypothetical protein